MFNGLLKSKFYTKCKAAIKKTETQIEMVRRKRNAMQKHLRNDIADLLKTGFDIIAYGRAEGFLVELNISSCYDLIEQFCGCLTNHLSLMSKQRECPEECKEAVSSLMFAAARFADLPELRNLRSVFTKRYGNSLDSYISQEFVKRLKSVATTKNMKLQLLQEIALEVGIEWNSKALEQKLYNPPAATEQDESTNTNDDRYKLQRNKDESVEKIDNHDAGNRHVRVRDYTAPDRNEEDLSSRVRTSLNENIVHDKQNRGYLSGKLEDTKDILIDHNSRPKNSKTVESASKEEEEEKLPFYYRVIPPPYTKPNTSKNGTGLEIPGPGVEDSAPTKLNLQVNEEDNRHEDKPKPRSVRRSRLKPPPGYQNPQEEDAKHGLKIFNKNSHDKVDEEERRWIGF